VEQGTNPHLVGSVASSPRCWDHSRALVGKAPGSGFLDGKPEKEWGFTSQNVDLSYEKSLKEWISPVKMWIEATN
jgi:hypothetical protein